MDIHTQHTDMHAPQTWHVCIRGYTHICTHFVVQLIIVEVILDIRCPLTESLGTRKYMNGAKVHMILCACGERSVSAHVAHVRRHFLVFGGP